jgi:ribosomal protein S16
MHKKLVIKMFKLRKKSSNNITKIIVVGWNTTKVNGAYLDKIGSYGVVDTYIDKKENVRPKVVCWVNTKKLAFWLNKGAIIKSSRIS